MPNELNLLEHFNEITKEYHQHCEWTKDKYEAVQQIESILSQKEVSEEEISRFAIRLLHKIHGIWSKKGWFMNELEETVIKEYETMRRR